MSELRTDKILNTASGTSVKVDRTSSDGSVIDIQKDGTTVGSIGAKADDMYLGTNTCGFRFLDASNIVRPATASDGAANDNAISLGDATSRFKDLTLSGNIYLGGTGSANALDDYETGTWTPTVNEGTVSGTNTKYTKVGRKVFIQGYLDTFSDRTSANAIVVSGLPFTSSSTQTSTGSIMYRYIDQPTSYYQISPFVSTNVSSFVFYTMGDNQNWVQVSHDELASANSRIYISITYTVD